MERVMQVTLLLLPACLPAGATPERVRLLVKGDKMPTSRRRRRWRVDVSRTVIAEMSVLNQNDLTWRGSAICAAGRFPATTILLTAIVSLRQATLEAHLRRRWNFAPGGGLQLIIALNVLAPI